MPLDGWTLFWLGFAIFNAGLFLGAGIGHYQGNLEEQKRMEQLNRTLSRI